MNFNINPNCKELIEKGICKADCCGCVPMYAQYWQRLKKYVQNSDYELFKFRYKGEDFIKAVTKDFKCVFVKDDFSCAIHHTKLRPEVCCLYGTDEKEPLLACPHINQENISFIVQSTDKIMNKLVAKNDKAAVELDNRLATKNPAKVN